MVVGLPPRLYDHQQPCHCPRHGLRATTTTVRLPATMPSPSPCSNRYRDNRTTTSELATALAMVVGLPPRPSNRYRDDRTTASNHAISLTMLKPLPPRLCDYQRACHCPRHGRRATTTTVRLPVTMPSPSPRPYGYHTAVRLPATMPSPSPCSNHYRHDCTATSELATASPWS